MGFDTIEINLVVIVFNNDKNIDNQICHVSLKSKICKISLQN